jgi:hypothetical protein
MRTCCCWVLHGKTTRCQGWQLGAACSGCCGRTAAASRWSNEAFYSNSHCMLLHAAAWRPAPWIIMPHHTLLPQQCSCVPTCCSPGASCHTHASCCRCPVRPQGTPTPSSQHPSLHNANTHDACCCCPLLYPPLRHCNLELGSWRYTLLLLLLPLLTHTNPHHSRQPTPWLPSPPIPSPNLPPGTPRLTPGSWR